MLRQRRERPADGEEFRTERGRQFAAALAEMQSAMSDEAQRAGIETEADVVELCKEVRRELIY